ncbi:hypothetical protein HYY75_01150 [bacterium]|nr:hypothetical protein [bacterium]
MRTNLRQGTRGSVVALALLFAVISGILLAALMTVHSGSMKQSTLNIFEHQATFLAKAAIEHAIHKIKKTTWFVTDQINEKIARGDFASDTVSITLDQGYLSSLKKEGNPYRFIGDDLYSGSYKVQEISVRVKVSQTGTRLKTKYETFLITIKALGSVSVESKTPQPLIYTRLLSTDYLIQTHKQPSLQKN